MSNALLLCIHNVMVGRMGARTNTQLVLFGGKMVMDRLNESVTLDGWLIPVPARTAVMIKELRMQLEGIPQQGATAAD